MERYKLAWQVITYSPLARPRLMNFSSANPLLSRQSAISYYNAQLEILGIKLTHGYRIKLIVKAGCFKKHQAQCFAIRANDMLQHEVLNSQEMEYALVKAAGYDLKQLALI